MECSVLLQGLRPGSNRLIFKINSSVKNARHRTVCLVCSHFRCGSGVFMYIYTSFYCYPNLFGF